MIEGLISLASYYPAGGDLFGNVLFQWEQAGVFAYVLPFMVIFGIIFGLMEKIKIFDSKGLNVVIALASALMSLQFNLVSMFFSEIFPRLGIGLGILLVFLIIMGLAFPNNKFAHWWFVIFMAIIFITILWNTFSAVGWNFGSGYWNYQSLNWGNIVLILVVIGGIIAIIGPNLKGKVEAPGTLFEEILKKSKV